jgi:superfamily II DNA or RNA helicase
MDASAPNVDLRLHHWGRDTLAFLERHVRGGTRLIRIATGFFSVPAYAALRPSIAGTLTWVLVGFDERAHDAILENLLEEILEDLRSWNEDRYELVAALARDLGQSLRLVNARTRENDHAKVYIVDTQAALVGSSNLTIGGLKRNSEAVTAVTEPEGVAYWVRAFDDLWTRPDTIDITEALRERLEAWLALQSPWDVYLKAASVLLRAHHIEPPSDQYREPTEYQMVVVRRVTKQLRDPERRGAIVIASTGLGKTIIGTHTALELHRREVINHVVVFAPVNVHPEWTRRLRSARISAECFTIDLLNRGPGASTERVDTALSEIDARTLIVVDEAHRFRNRYRSQPLARRPVDKHVFDRIGSAVARSGCRVLLLTATPYATGEANINNQLSLLPHTSRRPPSSNGQAQMGFFDTYAWSVERVEDLIELDVATVLNTPFVARVFGRRDDVLHADYLQYPTGERQYFPAVRLNRAQVPLPEAEAIAKILDGRILRHAYKSIIINGEYRKGDNIIERTAATAWASSPPALTRTLEAAARDDEYDVKFIVPAQVREDALRPVIDRLKRSRPELDAKLLALRAIVFDARQRQEKAVIFTERHETAAYLLENLSDLVPPTRITCIVQKTKGRLALRPSAEIQRRIRQFAPKSNRGDDGRLPEDLYDVLVCTDAAAEGINLQDASVLVNYDLAWTPDVIIQRAGRIMRLWHEPRTIRVDCFVPAAGQPRPAAAPSRLPEERLARLEQRLDNAAHLTELRLLPKEGQQTVMHLSELSSLPLLENELTAELTVHPDLGETTKVLHDYSTYDEHKHLADALPDDIATARVAAHLQRDLVISLVRFENEVVPIMLDPMSGNVSKLGDVLALKHAL